MWAITSSGDDADVGELCRGMLVPPVHASSAPGTPRRRRRRAGRAARDDAPKTSPVPAFANAGVPSLHEGSAFSQPTISVSGPLSMTMARCAASAHLGDVVADPGFAPMPVHSVRASPAWGVRTGILLAGGLRAGHRAVRRKGAQRARRALIRDDGAGLKTTSSSLRVIFVAAIGSGPHEHGGVARSASSRERLGDAGGSGAASEAPRCVVNVARCAPTCV